MIFASVNAVAETIQSATPIDRSLPEYPDSAGAVEGYVTLRFTIGRDGHVKDASVVESNPQGVFDKAAIQGLGQWTYRPRLVDGRPSDQTDNRIVMRFKPPEGPALTWLNSLPPLYPRKAFDMKIEGTVKVGFDLTDMGTTTNIHILESSAPGVFDSAAVEDVDQRIYKPIVVDGHAQPVTALTTVIDYKLANARVKPKPTHIVKPTYPSEAERTGAIGFCDLDLTIAPDGSVANAVVVESFPRGVFEKESLRVIKHWTFETAAGTGVPIAEHMYYKFNFRMSGVPESAVHYLKPGQWIKLDYTMTTDGRAKDIAVVEQSEPGLPTSKAVEQLKLIRFSPILENGVPVEKQHLQIKIN